jgi:hypothetical protein
MAQIMMNEMHALKGKLNLRMGSNSVTEKPNKDAIPEGAAPVETPTLRDKLKSLVTSNSWEFMNGAIIMFNLGLIVIETDIEAKNQTTPVWLSAVNYILVMIFAGELCLTAYVFRLDMLKDKIMVLDASIVIADTVGTFISLIFEDLPVNISVMRVLRLLRITKTRKLSIMFPELRMLGTSIVGATKPLFWGAVLIGIMLITWGILAVQILHPINETIDHGDCERCPRAFSTVWQSMITFTQGILLGDSWGVTAIPLLEAHPASGFFLCLVVVTLDIALLNVLMASVVDAAQQARLDNDAYMADIRAEEEEEAKRKFVIMCKSMDGDGSGMLTFAELEGGYHSSEHFRNVLDSMDIHEADLKIVWDILDEDNSGDLSYLEFTDELFKMKSSDSHTTLMFVKHYVQDIRSQMAKSLTVIKEEICTNITTMMGVEQKEVDMLEAEKKELEKVEQQLMETQQKEKEELEIVEQELLEDQKKEMAAMEKLEGELGTGTASGKKANPLGGAAKARKGTGSADAATNNQLLNDIYAICTELKAMLSASGPTAGQGFGSNSTTGTMPEGFRANDLRTNGRNDVSTGWCGVHTAAPDRRGYILDNSLRPGPS